MKASLKSFGTLPKDYIVLDTETTGLSDAEGPPGIIAIGLTMVRNKVITDSMEFRVKPYRSVETDAIDIHGISDEEAQTYPDIATQWLQVKTIMDHQLIVIHNSRFDRPILDFHIAYFDLLPLEKVDYFCSQQSAIEFAEEENIEMSSRGPSLDALSDFLGITSLRESGIHGAEIDSRQTAQVVERLRELALQSKR